MSAGMTRAERSARNKRAHAIRRHMTDEDRRTAVADGLELTWRAISDTYAAMSTDEVLSAFGDLELTDTPATVADVLEPVKAKRRAPAHIAAASETYHLARAAWEAGLEEALAGGSSLAAGGRPARGESYPDEERDYRAAHPAPVFKDYLAAAYADMRIREAIRYELERGK